MHRMTNLSSKLRRGLGVGVVWGVLWLSFWAAAGLAVAIVDPASMDPGDPQGMLAIFGPMGLLSGLAFASLLQAWAPADPSLLRVTGLGVLGTGLVQLAYLGHGDQGLTANLLMASAIALVGGLVTMGWYATTRLVQHSRRRLMHS
jgi:hypothetical protein